MLNNGFIWGGLLLSLWTIIRFLYIWFYKIRTGRWFTRSPTSNTTTNLSWKKRLDIHWKRGFILLK